MGATLSSNMVEDKKMLTILVSLTGIIHLGVGIASTLQEPILLNISLILNGLGYFALLTALFYLPQFEGHQDILEKILLGFTAVTIVGYFVALFPEYGTSIFINPVGMITKLIEVGIIVVLLRDSSPSE